MKLPLTPQLRAELTRFQLRFCCEDCVHFDQQQHRCAHGWPTELHRRARYQRPDCDQLVFCKEFELL